MIRYSDTRQRGCCAALQQPDWRANLGLCLCVWRGAQRRSFVHALARRVQLNVHLSRPEKALQKQYSIHERVDPELDEQQAITVGQFERRVDSLRVADGGETSRDGRPPTSRERGKILENLGKWCRGREER